MKLKSKLCKTVVRPEMVYESECWTLRKQEKYRLDTTHPNENAKMESRKEQERKKKVKVVP